jgi:hypothetical protein
LIEEIIDSKFELRIVEWNVNVEWNSFGRENIALGSKGAKFFDFELKLGQLNLEN